MIAPSMNGAISIDGVIRVTYSRQTPKQYVWFVAGLLVAGTTLTVHAAAQCDQESRCDRSLCEKTYELEKAQQYGDTSKVLALQHSIAQIEANCARHVELSPERYRQKIAELEQEKQDDLADARFEYEADLEDAISEGKNDKVRRVKEKYQQKIDKIEAEFVRKRDGLTLVQ